MNKSHARTFLLVDFAPLWLAVLLLVGTFFLISPPRGQTFPGAIPWSPHSLLRVLIDAMSLGGVLFGVRGAEIKETVFQLAASFGLIVLSGRLLVRGDGAGLPRDWSRHPAASSQWFLAAWVGISLCSASWAGDRSLALTQAALHAFGVAWALSLAYTLRRADLPRLLSAIVLLTSVAAALCGWYYHERNPHHRPGFPLGNPLVLAAAMLPAMIICICRIADAVAAALRGDSAPSRRAAVASAVALIPLAYCFALTSSRGATLALGVSLGLLVVIVAGRRTRWVIASAMLLNIAAAGVWFIGYSSQDPTMARGATIRFRLYAWRYAAELWQQRPWAGHGAGCYPRLASQFAAYDRAVDPAAFMGDVVGHAHNELFEIFAEIGLVGGVTWVAGMLAACLAAVRLRRQAPPRERWVVLALLGSFAALLADSLTGVNLRLGGVPALFFTLLGLIWAAARHAAETDASASPALARAPGRSPGASAALIAGVVMGALAAMNAMGVRREYDAYAAIQADDAYSARLIAARAESMLLDPLRKLACAELHADAELGLARFAVEQYAEAAARQTPGAAASAPADLGALRDSAVQQCQTAFDAAEDLLRRSPAFRRVSTNAARAAEWLAALLRAENPRGAAEWHDEAEKAWRRQRLWLKYDAETLLALADYLPTMDERIGALRDALRSVDAKGAWLGALRSLAQQPGFQQTLESMMDYAAPIDPQSEPNAIVTSMAPEMHRVAAAFAGLRGDYVSAASAAARAAALYDKLRVRFPLLYSIARGEQADYLLEGDWRQADRAAETLESAIAALPKIQEQKYEEMLQPFRDRLILCRLAAGRETEAAALLKAGDADAANQAGGDRLADAYVTLVRVFIKRPVEARPPLSDRLEAALRLAPSHLHAWSWLAWLHAERGDAHAVNATLRRAAAVGVTSADLARVRRSLAEQFPAMRESLVGDGDAPPRR
ncbi:O-Antigen ligase [Phycisphaerae bacterium RAS1]|nr:O-Antigen ligase [Phycisphaerae bacterium RAS1]